MNAAVILIYCDYRDQTNQTIVGMVGSLAKQLLLQAQSIPATVQQLFKGMEKEEKPINLDSAQAIFKLALQQFDCVYICLDALDECQPEARRQLLELFKTVTGTILRLFITGRPNVEAELANSFADRPVSKVPIAAHKDDILLYLSERFSRDRYREAMDETLRTQITDKILEWSQGM